MEKKTFSEPSIQKILISYAEYNRLKSVEEAYQKIEKEKEKNFSNFEESSKFQIQNRFQKNIFKT
jgi:hypothetical protein